MVHPSGANEHRRGDTHAAVGPLGCARRGWATHHLGKAHSKEIKLTVKDTAKKPPSTSKLSSAPKKSVDKTANQKAVSKPPADSTQVSKEAQSPQQESQSQLSGLLSGMSDWAGRSEPSQATGGAEQNPASLQLGEGELLRQGRNNPEQVTQLQEMLNSSGAQLEVDGKFGTKTAEAVRRFQQERNLQVDGVVGPQTMAALNGGGTQAEGAVESPQNTTGEPPANATGDAPANAAAETATTPPATNDSQGRSTTRLEGIPPRPEDARSGSEFMQSISNLPPGPQRDQAVLNEILSGNIPENSRNLQELVVNRNGREIRMNVMSDYLSIGSNEDNVRIPMTPAVAQAIADRTGTSLPTDRIVDDIHSQSTQLHMAPMSNNRESIGTYAAHDQRIDGQLGSGTAPTGLVSGHKKDIVIPARNGRVAIYGGRWPNGGRIQSYSNVHHSGYEDYSHGARLVSQQITVDGRSMSLSDALADPNLAPLFTNHQGGSFRY